jgi:hypothetical protein
LGSHPYLEEIAFSLPRRFDGWNAKQWAFFYFDLFFIYWDVSGCFIETF